MCICIKCGQTDILTRAGVNICQACAIQERSEQVANYVFPKAEARDGYETLRAEFAAAAEQASGGKGKERHASGQAFDDQPILVITRLLGKHPCGALAYQVIKKTVEAGRLLELRGVDAAVNEIYGAMNYAAAMAIRLKEMGKRGKED